MVTHNDVGMESAVSPALNINLSSIIFSSLISGNVDESGAEYKLTLVDENIAISAPDAPNISRSGMSITVPFSISGNNSSNVTQISYVVSDGTWTHNGWSNGAKIKAYGKLDITNSSVASSSGIITLPNGYNKNWHTYIIAEDINLNKESNYASVPFEISVPEDNDVIDNTTLYSITGKIIEPNNNGYPGVKISAGGKTVKSDKSGNCRSHSPNCKNLPPSFFAAHF